MNKQYDSLIDAADFGGELILINNVSEASIKISKDTVLDLNGFSVGYGIEQSDNTIIIDGGSLTVKDSSAEKLGAVLNAPKYDGSVAAIRIKNGGTLTLESGTVSSTKCAIYCEDEAIVNINGGTVIGLGTVGMGVFLDSNVVLNISDGKIVAESSSTYAIAANVGIEDYSITIDGGIIEGTIGHAGTGTLVINDGMIIGVDAAIVMRKGTLEINGGTLSTISNISRERGVVPNASGDYFEKLGAVIHVDATMRGSK